MDGRLRAGGARLCRVTLEPPEQGNAQDTRWPTSRSGGQTHRRQARFRAKMVKESINACIDSQGQPGAIDKAFLFHQLCQAEFDSVIDSNRIPESIRKGARLEQVGRGGWDMTAAWAVDAHFFLTKQKTEE